MATNLVSGGNATQRNIPASLIDEARRHVYEAAVRTPLVRLNYDGPSEIYLKLECLQPIGSFKYTAENPAKTRRVMTSCIVLSCAAE